MLNRLLCFTIAMVWLSSFHSVAQKQNNNWCLGNYCGITFNTPVPLSYTTSIKSYENCSTVSDTASGNLLFYTDGFKAWDKNNNLMPHAIALGDDYSQSSSQGSAIVPDLSDPKIYYIFCTDNVDHNTAGILHYSKINMNLNGGLGDVDTNFYRISLGNQFGELLTVVAGNNCDLWILALKRSGYIYAYNFTSSGLNPSPVISKAVTSTLKIRGGLKVSGNRRKLAISGHCDSIGVGFHNYSFTTLYDFDPNTGIVSNGLVIDSLKNGIYYGCEFSSNSNRLYISDASKNVLYQYNVSLPSAAIAGSKTTVTTPALISGMQLGPDRQLYFASYMSTSLGIIHNANSPAPSFIVNPLHISMPPGSNVRMNMPRRVIYPNDIIINTIDTLICFRKNVIIGPESIYDYYKWNNGSSNPKQNISRSGKYWITYTKNCNIYIDTFNVTIIPDSIFVTNDTTICPDDTITLSAATTAPGATYTWYPDSIVSSSIKVSKAGQYYITTVSGLCKQNDTTNLNTYNPFVSFIGDDTILCNAQPHRLAVGNGYSKYKWSTGDTTSYTLINKTGKYWVEVYEGKCTYRDTINLEYMPKQLSLGKDILACIGDIVQLNTNMPHSSFTWQDGSILPYYDVSKNGIYWVIASNVCGNFTDSVKVEFKECNCKYTMANAFTPNNDGLNDRIWPYLVCDVSEYSFIIANRWGQIVYSSSTPGDKWDGTVMNQPGETGVYYYMLKLKNTAGNSFLYKGDITLIR